MDGVENIGFAYTVLSADPDYLFVKSEGSVGVVFKL